MATAKILVVEDEEDILELLLFSMRRDNYNVVGAKSGEEAITVLTRERFDLILLDIMLPQKNGFEVLNFIKTTTSTADTPVILLSALTNTETIVKGLSGGAVDYITKPFSVSELSARVKLHLQVKTANDELRASDKKLRQTLAAKEKFFRIIAHDLRGPVAALHGYAKLLTNRYRNWPQPKQEKCLQTMEETSAHVSSLLENLLQWAQNQSNNLGMQPEPLNLLALCQETATPLHGGAYNKEIRINIDIHPEATVYADRQALASILRNLLDNAIKYSSPGGKVTISAQLDHDRAEIAVTDSGVGIDKDDLDKLFRIDASHSTPGTNNEKGTGLGLTLCREFVEKNHGQISVQSTLGEGSSFIFTLPRSPSPDTFKNLTTANDNQTFRPFRPPPYEQKRLPHHPA